MWQLPITIFWIYLNIFFYSSSKLGGVISISCYFFNHEECTRVMWTPPLRESFGYPLSLIQIFLVSYMLNNSISPSSRLTKSISISIFTTFYLLSWQFAQFTLFTQVCILFTLHVLGLAGNVKNVFYSLMVSYGC